MANELFVCVIGSGVTFRIEDGKILLGVNESMSTKDEHGNWWASPNKAQIRAFLRKSGQINMMLFDPAARAREE